MRSNRLLLSISGIILLLILIVTSATANTRSLYDTIATNNSHTIFTALVQEVGLDNLLRNNGPFTVFAPTDAAFAALPTGTIENMSATDKRQLVLYHFVQGSFTSEQIGATTSLRTALGKDIAVSVVNGALTLNDTARITQPNSAASNGLLHVIDAVLLPTNSSGGGNPPPPPPPPPTGSIAYRDRFGLYGWTNQIHTAQALGLTGGTMISSNIDPYPSMPNNVNFWQVVRLTQAGTRRSYEDIETTINANRGATWVIGNEPDVIWQDNVTPEKYAELYHDLYYFIKGKDPQAIVAVGGVSTPTPLRRTYLDMVLRTYEGRYGEKLPTDLWTVHAYILREERGGWGVDIPPGINWTDTGILYEIDDHARYELLHQHFREFRAWLDWKGYDVPLAVTEFGILLPADFGFPPEVVSEYMRGMVDFFLSATASSGYSGDGNRLVQWWFWFSVHDLSGEFNVSDLIDPVTGQLTPIGETYASYLR